MNWKDKADVMQGIAAAYIFALTIINAFGLPRIPIEMYFGFFITVWVIVPLILGIVTVGLKEDNGLDLFGIILTTMSFMNLIGFFLPTEISGTVAAFLGIGMLITAVGLLLEAFDIIKPIKYR
jgi:hypothetical protein